MRKLLDVDEAFGEKPKPVEISARRGGSRLRAGPRPVAGPPGVIRYVKKRPEFRSNPAKIRVRAPTQEQREGARRRGQRHVRDRAFAIVRRAERELGRGWLTLV